ncbi:MAG: hypothetical protein WCJ01_00185 [Ignavibacteria bacterium]
MKVGIIEVMPLGHFTLVESVMEVFASDCKNEIFIFTHRYGSGIITPVVKDKKNVHVVTKDEVESLSHFFKRIGSFQIDKLYIITLEKYFKEFYSAKFNSQVVLLIHNIDEWSNFSFGYNINCFLFSFSNLSLIYNLKKYLIYPYWRKKILNKQLQSNGKFVVLSENLRPKLSYIVPAGKTEVIPFSVYNKNLADKSGANTILKVSIPGKLSTMRRDYTTVFTALESDIDFFKDKIELLLLGSIAEYEGGLSIKAEADRLISKGIKIKYFSEKFIPFEEYDEHFASTDIVLGNMKVVIDKLSIYGKTKETGFTFTLIHYAKPGLVVSGYDIFEELKSSTVAYTGARELRNILNEIITNKEKLRHLKEEAKKNSLLFSPGNIYKKLK